MLKYCVDHAVELLKDGVHLQPAEVLDVEAGKGNGCRECNRPED